MSVAFPTTGDNNTFRKAHTWTQIRLLLQRDYRDMIRNTYVTGARLALTIAMSALVGALYYKVGTVPMSDLIVSTPSTSTSCFICPCVNEIEFPTFVTPLRRTFKAILVHSS